MAGNFVWPKDLASLSEAPLVKSFQFHMFHLCVSLYNHHQILSLSEGPEGNCCLANVVGQSTITPKRLCVLKHKLISLHPNIFHAFSCLYNSSHLESSKACGGDNQTHSEGFQRFFHACCASLYFFQRRC